MAESTRFNILLNEIKARNLRELPQTGNRVSALRDMARQAQPAGKRISRNNKIYWETRKNRSDVKGTTL